MADNVPMKRIYFKEFFDIMQRSIFSKSIEQQMRFAFFILDIDHNGYLNGPDLLTVQENIENTSEYGEELQYVINHFVKTHLLVKDSHYIRTQDLINQDKYTSLLPGKRSCIIDEFKKKILAKPGKYSNISVLSKRSLAMLKKR